MVRVEGEVGVVGFEDFVDGAAFVVGVGFF
jgi:hypothetical protein